MRASRTTADTSEIAGRFISTLAADESDLLILHLADPTGEQRLSAWMTAKDDAYVSLLNAR